MNIAISLIFGYLLGSILFAGVIAKIKGKDIFEIGSKNPGAANVGRELGKRYGALVWILDMIKGIIPMIIADKIFHLSHFWVTMAGVCAVCGHCWPLWFKFRGGKGVSTSSAVFLYILPKSFLIALFAYWFVQKNNRSVKRVVWTFLITFLIVLGIYYKEIKWLLPALIIFLGVGTLANLDAIKEMRRKTSYNAK